VRTTFIFNDLSIPNFILGEFGGLEKLVGQFRPTVQYYFSIAIARPRAPRDLPYKKIILGSGWFWLVAVDFFVQLAPLLLENKTLFATTYTSQHLSYLDS
jgi:hypothetical protein